MDKHQRFVVLMMTLLLVPVLLAMVGNYENVPMSQHGVYFNGVIIEHVDLVVIVGVVLGAWLFCLCGVLLIMRSMEHVDG